jgi:sec-independent protein translocase protein TatA
MGGFTSGSHWLIVFGIVILLFGAKKIPELAKGMGQGIRNFKKEMKEEEPAATAPAAPEATKQVEPTTATIVEATPTNNVKQA